MADALYSLDRALLLFLNQTIQNPVGDVLWPLITDYDRFLAVRLLLLAVWLVLVWKGGTRGRTVAVMLLPVILIADQLSSSILKQLFVRARPCHEIAGVPVVQGLHLLVDCGAGKSFPSSHAVNNFAVATLFAHYYVRWRWAFYAWATLVAISRCAVGVHYPSDIIGGAVIGVLVALLVVYAWAPVERRRFPNLARVSASSKKSLVTDEQRETTEAPR